MKKNKFIFFTLIVLLSLFSCKKDYPKDIPDWLKDKIECCKNKDCSSQNKECFHLTIAEYTLNGSIIYYFTDDESAPNKHEYFDYNGLLICSTLEYLPYDTCSYFIPKDLIYKRKIWGED